ncbi:MAG: hypothetical protein SFU25_02855 [Candidatus Caenarcaniphilales bacterium]|nr:hypothetical protein [Candidatus Caenarcaniphilales bacterium]
MLFKLNSYNEDSSTGHSVYQFILAESNNSAPANSYDGSYFDETCGIHVKGMQLLITKLSQIKLEALTIKQLLN